MLACFITYTVSSSRRDFLSKVKRVFSEAELLQTTVSVVSHRQAFRIVHNIESGHLKNRTSLQGPTREHQCVLWEREEQKHLNK